MTACDHDSVRIYVYCIIVCDILSYWYTCMLIWSSDDNVFCMQGQDTPLHKAAHNGHVQIVELLGKNGANISMKNKVS